MKLTLKRIAKRDTYVGKVLESKDTFVKLYPILKAASDKKDRITITIK